MIRYHLDTYPIRPDDPVPLHGLLEWLNRLGMAGMRLVAWHPMPIPGSAGAVVVCIFIME